jgi:hypothetical protein
MTFHSYTICYLIEEIGRNRCKACHINVGVMCVWGGSVRAKVAMLGSVPLFTLKPQLTWALTRSAVRQVHWMRPGRECDSMRLAVLIVSPNSVYLFSISGIKSVNVCTLHISDTVSGTRGVLEKSNGNKYSSAIGKVGCASGEQFQSIYGTTSSHATRAQVSQLSILGPLVLIKPCSL